MSRKTHSHKRTHTKRRPQQKASRRHSRRSDWRTKVLSGTVAFALLAGGTFAHWRAKSDQVLIARNLPGPVKNLSTALARDLADIPPEALHPQPPMMAGRYNAHSGGLRPGAMQPGVVLPGMPMIQGGRAIAQGYSLYDGIRQQFTSYERDIETGLDYAQARYYANLHGRFTSPDPMLSSGKPAEPQSWNRYAYVGNNPLMFIDPSGLIWGYRDYEQDGKKMREFQWFDGDQAGEGFTNYNHSYFVSQKEVIWLDSGSSAFLQISKDRFSDAEFASLASTDPANISQDQRNTLNRAVADSIWASEGPRIKAVASLVGGLFGGLGGSFNFTFGAASRQAARLPPVLFHYTDEAGAAAIQSSQLGRADRFLYLTSQGGLTPLQAQLELALPAQNSARALFAVDSQALNTPSLLRSGRVTGNIFGRPGGGTEFMFNKGTAVPASSFTRFRF